MSAVIAALGIIVALGRGKEQLNTSTEKTHPPDD